MHVKYNCCTFKVFKSYLKIINNKIKYVALFTAIICIFTQR